MYRAGAARLRQFVEWCDDAGVEIVTLWVLSTENLTRNADDVGPLLGVIQGLVEDLARTGRWRVGMVGDPALLPPAMVEAIQRAERATTARTGMRVKAYKS